MRQILLALLLFCAAPAAAAEIKLATWNIAWLTLKQAGHPDLPRDLTTRAPQDFVLLRQYATRLAADVIAIQEIDGAEAAGRVFDPALYAIHLTDEPDIQRPGFAIRRTLRFTANPDLAALDLRPGARRSLRRGADITLETPGGVPLRLLSVHLNAGCREAIFGQNAIPECESLSRQGEIIAAWAAARQREGVAFVILGDFNRRMDERDLFLRGIEQAAPVLRPTAGVSTPCWADSRGGRTFISHFLLGGAAREWMVPRSLGVMVYAERDRSYRDRLSDHCPMSVRLNMP